LRVYTVHESANPTSDRLDRAEGLRFVRDGFTWSAAIFTPLWLLVRGFWLALAIYLIVTAAVAFGVTALGLGDQVHTLIMIGLHLLIGFEADTIERWTLKRRGWEMIGSVSGRDIAECERRFFDSWLPDHPMLRPETLSLSQITGSGTASTRLGGGTAQRSGGWRSPFPFGARH
jgi:hypothetical protein